MSFKRKPGRLGPPPSPSEVTGNLDQPEHAPAPPAPVARPVSGNRKHHEPLKDLNFKVPETFHEEFARAAFENKLKRVDLLKEAFEIWKKSRQ